jgi:hypothetical protein
MAACVGQQYMPALCLQMLRGRHEVASIAAPAVHEHCTSALTYLHLRPPPRMQLTATHGGHRHSTQPLSRGLSIKWRVWHACRRELTT